MDFTTSAVILAWLAILVLSLAMAGMLRQVHLLRSGRTHEDDIGPPVGSKAPPLPETRQRLAVPLVALFLDAHCESCERTLRAAEELVHQGVDQVEFLGLFATALNGHTAAEVPLVADAMETFERYQIPATPFGVAISTTGKVLASTALGSAEELQELVDQAVGQTFEERSTP